MKDGVELTWSISDNGDLELINLKYNWTTQTFSSRNISTIELEGIITLEDIPDSAKSIQISVANNRGESLLSESFIIQCGYKGCEPTSSELIIIVVGVVCSFGGIVIGIFIVIVSRKLKNHNKSKDDSDNKISNTIYMNELINQKNERETTKSIPNAYEIIHDSNINENKTESKEPKVQKRSKLNKDEEKVYETISINKNADSNYLKPDNYQF
jgi:hypothetical protein